MNGATSSLIFNVRRPDGKIFEVPEHNLDYATSPEMGGEVVGDPYEAPIQQQPTQQDTNVQQQPPQELTNPQKTYEVRRPDGKIWNVPEANLKKAQELGGQVIDDPQDDEVNEYTGENSVAAFSKNVGSSFAGGALDLGASVYNIPARIENAKNEATKNDTIEIDPISMMPVPKAPGERPQLPLIPSATEAISSAIDKATDGYTNDTSSMNKHAGQFLGSLFGIGGAGKLLQYAGSANKLGKASGAAESTGSYIANNLGLTSPSISNVAGATASGATLGALEDNHVPTAVQIPAAILSFILAGKAGGFADGKIKNSAMVQNLFKDMPGVQKYLEKGHYQDIAKNINPESISDLIKTSLIEKETEFLTQKTISELPKEIQIKLNENPALLNDEEINLVVEKGMKDFTSNVDRLEKEYGYPLTLAEYTGNAKTVAKEDALANKPNIDTFDVATKNRKLKLVRRLEKIKHDLSSEAASTEEIGEITTKAVDSIYSDAQKIRSDNWNAGHGKFAEENILTLSEYQNKLKEFAKLRPDNEGNIVAIKSAKRRLNDGIEYERKISPKRFNDILVGLNDEARRFPDKTFSRKQISELRSSLENDLTKNIENAATEEQASILRNTRSRYAEDSKIIDQIDESVLFSKINKDSLQIPEKVAQAFNNMPTSQLRLTFDALKRSSNHHEVIPKIQRFYIEEAFKAATKGGVENFNPRIFLEKLPKADASAIIFGDAQAYKEIRDISVLLKRSVRYHPSRSNSKTAQRAQADRGDLEDGISNAAIQISKGNVLDLFTDILKKGDGSSYDKKVAELLTSPDKRKSILKEINKPRNRKKTAVALMAYANSKND